MKNEFFSLPIYMYNYFCDKVWTFYVLVDDIIIYKAKNNEIKNYINVSKKWC